MRRSFVCGCKEDEFCILKEDSKEEWTVVVEEGSDV